MSMVQRGAAVGDGTPLSMDVIDAIAEREGVDPIELETPIYDVIDLDAVDALTTGEATGNPIEVSFTYEGYEVTVDTDHDVRISAIDE